MGSEESTGNVTTRWFQAVPRFAIYISGYLTDPSENLFIAVANAEGRTTRIRVPPELAPGEAWWVKEFALPQNERPIKFRFVGSDGGTNSQAWIGFSDPFVIQSIDGLQIAKQLLMILFVTAASFVAVFGPGLALRRRFPGIPMLWLPAPGIVLLVLLGLLSWIGPEAVKPRSISRVGLALLILFITYHLFRSPVSQVTSIIERRVLLIVLLVIAIAVAKSTYSLGPAGELYAGRISRTLEPGRRADSRMPYHAVQLIALRQSPHSARWL